MADRSRRIALAAIALPLLFLAMSRLASASPLTVTNTNDTGVGSLRAEILAASSGDTINFSVSGTITLGSPLPAIAVDLTIDGIGRAITVDGANTFQIFTVNLGSTVNLQNLTIAHGNAQNILQGEHGGGVENKGTLTVTNCTFSHNTAGLGGGAIDNVGTLMVISSTFSGNNAPNAGGIDNFDMAMVSNSTFSGNIGDNGGGMVNNGTLTISSSTFSGNNALIGGGIDNFAGTLTITNSTFSENTATSIGGGIDNTGLLSVTNCTFSHNSAVGIGGGGIDNEPLGSTTLKGTIMAAEPGGNCGGLITDAGYNISDEVSCPIASGTSVVDSTTLHLDPAGLANNGGPTQTIALEPNSQAVDFIPVAACKDQSSPTPLPLTTDQRGLPRPDPDNPDFCDAGAFELQTTPFVIAPNSERLQIARSNIPDSDHINTAFTFIENGFPACDAADNAFNGFFLVLESGTCAVHDHTSLLFFLNPWVVHTVNHQSYGTLFNTDPPLTVSARMVELPTPAAPACGEWSLNLEIAGIDSTPLGDGPFSLILSNTDGDTECFDINNAIVGSQTPPPPHGVRRRKRR